MTTFKNSFFHLAKAEAIIDKNQRINQQIIQKITRLMRNLGLNKNRTFVSEN